MATKNGVCPYCQLSHLANRIFPVNPDASTVFCPSCMREIDPKKAIDGYNAIIKKMVDKADSTLFVACDPVVAYQEYADVLEYEPENSKALLGRILCLIYTSKVRKSYLVEANALLQIINHKGADEANNYVATLKRVNFALDEFDTALNKKLSFHGYYYDEECLKLYLKHLYDIFKFKSDILDKLLKLRKDYSSQKNEVLINLINHSVQEKERQLKGTKYLISGQGVRLSKIVGDKVYLEQTKDKVDYHYPRKHSFTLGEGDKTHKTIKDRIFKDYTPMIAMKKAAIVISVIMLLAALGLGITSYFYLDDKLFFYIFVISGGVAALIALILFIVYLVWRRILKKREMRID